MAGTYKPGDVYVAEFTTHGASGGINADALPTASMAHNLIDDGTVTLVVANIDTGRYSVTATIPGGYAVGDKVSVKVAATVGGVSDKMILEQFVLDNRSADVLAAEATNATAIAAVGTAVTGVKAKTDQFAFTIANKVDSNALAVGDKAGYNLAATGLDTITVGDVTSDADARSTFPKLVRALFGRFFNAVSQTATTQTVSNSAGSVVQSMSVTDNGTTATKGKSA